MLGAPEVTTVMPFHCSQLSPSCLPSTPDPGTLCDKRNSISIWQLFQFLLTPGANQDDQCKKSQGQWLDPARDRCLDTANPLCSAPPARHRRLKKKAEKRTSTAINSNPSLSLWLKKGGGKLDSKLLCPSESSSSYGAPYHNCQAWMWGQLIRVSNFQRDGKPELYTKLIHMLIQF